MTDISEDSFFKFIRKILGTPSDPTWQYRWQDILNIMRNKNMSAWILGLAESQIGLNNRQSEHQIEKLKLSSIHREKVSLGLTVVGIVLFADYGMYHFLLKYVDDNSKAPDIKKAIVMDVIEKLFNRKHTEVITPNVFPDLWRSTLQPISNDIGRGIQTPEYIWGENEYGGLKMGGILGVVLKRVFQTQLTSEICEDIDLDLSTFLEVTDYFDNCFFVGIEYISKSS